MKITSKGRSSMGYFSVDQLLKLKYYQILDNMMAKIKWRFEK